MANNSQVNIGIKFKTDSKEVEQSLNKLKKSLQEIQKIKPENFSGTKRQLYDIQETANKVGQAMEKAFNPTLNTTNITTFKTALKDSGLTVSQVKSDFSKLGVQGEVAFNRMSSSLLTTNLQLKQTSKFLSDMGDTMVKTVKWGIASSIMNSFSSSVQGAFSYVQSLEKSLTNIRIVTGDSTQKMAQFADQANRSAQALGRSTLDYTKASLTFYQQGLNDQDVQARTEATLKAQNITGAGQEMADYLTSVWNGYKVANEEAELYVDKLAAVADSSASDMSELAIAMSKVASTAHTMGVDVDQLNGMIATVVATTRQAPEAVGTAFKTIFSRMNDIQAGAEDAEISLGNYSGKMAQLGFNVLDATGHLRDTGQVMEEIGGRWQNLTKEQQIYLAQTMGGQRQVNQLMALFDNWTTYSELLNTSLEAEGTLAQKNSVYMESLGAKMEQFGAAGERVKDALIDSDSLKTVIEGLTGVTNLVGNLFETMGSGNIVLLAFGSAITQLFSGTIAKEINNVITNMSNAKANAELLKNEIETTKMIQQTGGADIVTKNMSAIQKYYSVMDEGSINNYKNLVAQRVQMQNKIKLLQDQQNQVSKVSETINKAALSTKDWEQALGDVSNNNKLANVNDVIEKVKTSISTIRELSQGGFSLFDSATEDGQNFIANWKQFIDSYKQIDSSGKADALDNLFTKFQNHAITGQDFGKALDHYLTSASERANSLSTAIGKSQQELMKARDGALQVDTALRQSASAAQRLFDTTNIVKMVGAVGQMASVMMTIGNLGSIWKDEDISASEKILKTVTTLGFAIPSIITSMKNISSAMGVTQALAQRRLIIEKAITAEKEKQAAIDKRETLIKELKELKEKGGASEEVIEGYKEKIKSTNDLIERTSQTAIKAEKEAGKVGSTFSTAFGAAKTSVAGFVTQLGMIAPYVIAIGAIVGIGYSIYAAYNQASIAAEKAAKNAEQAKRKYDQLKESYKSLTSALEDYHEAESALSKLVKGTEEWYDQVNLLNDKVLELLQHYPELAKYVTMDQNGLLSINEKGQTEIKNQQRQRVYTAGMANADLQQQSYQANRKSQITDMGRNLYGLIGGPEVLNSIVKAVEKQGAGILGDQDRLRKETGLNLDPRQIEITQANTDAILNLTQSLNVEKNKIETLTDSIVRTNLNNEKQYRESQHKDAFADIYAKTIKQASGKLGEQFYKTVSDGYGNNYQVVDRQKVIDDYERLKGTDIKQGFFGGLSEKDAEGNYQKTTFEAIQAYVRASEANVDAAKLLQQAANRMTQAEKDFANADDRTKELLFNSGLAGGFDQINKNTLSENDISKLESLNQQDLADYLNIPIEELPEKFKELRESIQNGLDDFVNGIDEENTRAVMIKLKEQFGQNLSRELAESIARNVQEGYQKAGIKSGNAIRDFYKKLQGDQVNSITELASEYNFAGGSINDFTNAVREVGITSEQISDSMVKSFYDAQLKIQDIQVKENKLDPGKVNAINSTMSFGTQLNQTGKLNDKDLKAYLEGLQSISKTYPQLSKQVETLNNVSIAGTERYTAAVHDLKIALMGSYYAMGDLNKITKEDFDQQLKILITDVELLDDATQNGLVRPQLYQEILIKLASQYDNCKDELEKYDQALRLHDTTLQEAASFNLLLATRSAENANKYGIEAETIETLAKHYADLASQNNKAYQGMDESSKLAVDAATKYIRLNASIEDLQKNYTKVEEVFQALQQYDIQEVLGDVDYAKTFSQIKKDVEGMVGVLQGSLDPSFIKDNMGTILQIINNGSEEALESLQQLAAEDLWKDVKIQIDDTDFLDKIGESQEAITDFLSNIPPGQITGENLDFINTLAQALAEAGYTLGEIENLFNSADISLDIDTSGIQEMAAVAQEAAEATADSMAMDVSTNSSSQTQTDELEAGGYDIDIRPRYGWVQSPLYGQGVTGNGQLVSQIVGMDRQQIRYDEVSATPHKETDDVSKTTTATGIRVERAHKAPKGGKVSHKNRNGGNKKNSGGKGGKGGGSPKAKTPNKAKSATNTPDRYRDNTVKANKLNNQMTKLQKEADRLDGKKRIDNLHKQLQLLKEQNKVINERIRIQTEEQDELANNLKKYGATFDSDRTLNNYKATFNNIIDTYNKAVTKWNSATATWQEQNKDFLNVAKQEMDNALKDLARYDAVQQEKAKDIQNRIDNAQAQIDNKVKQFELKIEATLDLAKAKRDWNAFRRDVVKELRDDDILGLNDFRFADINSYFNQGGTGSIQQLADKLATITKSDTGVFSASYLNEKLQEMTLKDREAQLKEIESILGSLTSEMTDFKELADEIKDSIFDAIDAAQAAFDEQMDEYEFLGDTLEHNKKLIQLMYGDEAYEAMGKYYDEIQKNNNNQLDFLAKEKDLWYGRMMEEQARMKRLAQTEGIDSNAYKESQDRFKEYEKHWMDSVKNLNATLEDALENITDQYNNIIDETFLRYEKMMGGGHTLDDIKDEWDMLNDTADTYLDKINSAYEMEKLNNAFEDAIRENEGNVAAQQSLNDLMQQQLGYLRDKEKLTQYDVDRANTLLQIEIKRLALEQARSSKNRLRLRRDSQGNYTYQYTADTESISKAEQELADARNSLQNSDKAAYVDNLNAIQKSADTLKQKLEDIWKDQNLSKEQKLQKSYELQKYYGQQINDLLAENAVIRNNLMESSFEELAKIYGISADQFRAMSKEQQNELMKDLVPQTGSYIAQWVDNVMSNGGYTPYFEQMVDEMEKADDERRQKQVDALDKAQKNMENITNDVDILTQQIRRLIEPNDELINKHKQEIEQVTEYIVYLNKVLDMYQKIKEDATAAASAAYAVLKADAAGTLGSTLERENRVASNEKKARESYFKKNNSASDLGPDYKPYQPEFQSNDYAAIFGSFSGDELSVLQKQKADEIRNNTTLSEEQKQQALQKQDSLFYTVTRDINISSVLDSIEEGVLNINTLLNSIYLANDTFFKNSLNKQDDIKSTIANQTISINADFPNAKDVQAIIQAIESLPAKAAQYAGKV